MRYMTPSEKDLIIDGLLLKNKEAQKDYENLTNRTADESIAVSLLRRFLVEKHPELTDELAEFVLEKVKSNDYREQDISSCGISALEYHRDEIDSQTLDEVIKTLEQSAKGSK